MTAKGAQSCLGTSGKFQGREGQTAIIKNMPRLGPSKKAFSAGDIVSIYIHMYNEGEEYCMQFLYIFFQMQHGVTTEAELLGSYSSISSLHTERLVVSECSR